MYDPPMPKTFAQLIGTWPRDDDRTSIGTFADDIGLPYQHAATMRQRNSIAPEYWPDVLKAAKKRGKALTNDMLLKMRGAGRKKRPHPTDRALDKRPDGIAA